MAKTRDMSERQFLEALKRHGMTPCGFLAYVELGLTGMRTSVCRLNAGSNRRAQLAYLLSQKAEYEKEAEYIAARPIDGAAVSALAIAVATKAVRRG